MKRKNERDEFHVKAVGLRIDALLQFHFGGGGSRRGSSFGGHGGFVVVRGGFRKHRGFGAMAGAIGKMKAHISYIAGDRHKEGDRELRNLYDDRGREQVPARAKEMHSAPYIEHRIVLSPSTSGGKVSESDLHLMSQATIQEVRARNPQAEIDASYAIHTDTRTPHSHILMTSDQMVRLNKQDYSDLRDMNRDMREELGRMRSMGLENNQEIEFSNETDHSLSREFVRDQDMELGG